MDYDFFGDNEEEKKQESGGERIPAPVIYSGKGSDPTYVPPQRKKIRWWHVLLAIGVGLSVFFCGYLTCWLALDSEIRTLIDVKKSIQKNYYQEISDKDFYAAVFGGINDDLLDDYSEYMTPEEFAALLRDMEGNRSGVGLVFNVAGEELRIARVCGNSPAEAAGLKAGDLILGFGGTKESIILSTSFDEFSDFLAGYQENEKFYFKILSKDSEKVVELYKAEYVENYVFYRTKESAYTFDENSVMVENGALMSYLKEDTAYIQLIQFTGNAAQDFDKAMEQFKADGKKNLVLDLRGNGGGYLDTMQSIAKYFCKTAESSKPIVAVADFGESRTKYAAPSNIYKEYFAEDSRITVLADNGSASASECLIGAMIDYEAIGYGDICLAERGGIAKTFGKGIMQETRIVNLMQQDALKLTTAEIRWPISDNSIHGRGVLPEDGAKTVAENYDYEAETQAAIALLFE